MWFYHLIKHAFWWEPCHNQVGECNNTLIMGILRVDVCEYRKKLFLKLINNLKK